MPDKTKEERLVELELALHAMRNAAGHFHSEKDQSYLLTIVTQLRALVAFKPGQPKKKHQNLKPLLLDMADSEDIPLRLYSMPPKPKHGPKGLAVAILASKTWSVFPVAGYQQYTLRERLLAPAYHDDSRNLYKSRNDVIREIANKAAAHYDHNVTPLHNSMRRTFGSGYNGIQFFAIDTSAAVVYLGARFIRLQKLKVLGETEPEKHKAITSLDQEFHELKISAL